MIRPATESDIPRIVEMGQRFVAETSYKEHVGQNPEQMAKLVKQLIDGGGVLVSEENGKLYGMLGYLIFPHYVSGEIIAGEVFWWVEPEARGSGLKLMRAAEDKARSEGAKRFQFIAPTEKLERVYERLGYKRVEVSYQRTL